MIDEAVVIPLFEPTKTYDEIIIDCERLGLIETVMHGEHQYFRFTEFGRNIFWAMAKMHGHRADPANVMPVT